MRNVPSGRGTWTAAHCFTGLGLGQVVKQCFGSWASKCKQGFNFALLEIDLQAKRAGFSCNKELQPW